MFAALRRVWRSYLASIPQSDDPIRISDKEILREFPKPQPVEPQVAAAFSLLADLLTSHLNADSGVNKKKALIRRLKPGASPFDALCDWLFAEAGKRKMQVGVIALDWKAREEIEWQAALLAAAHNIQIGWKYDVDADNSWQGFQERGEWPVSAPLRNLSTALSEKTGVVLIQLSRDDVVFAFGVARNLVSQLQNVCSELSIEITGPVDLVVLEANPPL